MSYYRDYSREMASYDRSFVSSAPLGVQCALSVIAVVEKALLDSPTRSSASLDSRNRFILVSWLLHAVVLICLCRHAVYSHEFRPFLGTWVAFLLNAHLCMQLKLFTMQRDKVPLIEIIYLKTENFLITRCNFYRMGYLLGKYWRLNMSK